MKYEALHWIDGNPAGDPVIARTDPATGELVGHFTDGGADVAVAAIAAARRAFDLGTWAMAPRSRQRVLLDWAVALRGRAGELSELLTRVNGKTIAQSRAEIDAAISEVEYYAGLARHLPGHVLEPEPGVLSTVIREPAGVAGIIVPWNAPAVLLARAVAPALAAGCTVAVKPAAQTALFTAVMMAGLTAHCQLPAGVVNIFNEAGHAGAELLAQSQDVDVICFTGSTEIGRRIMGSAAANMKKLSLELGGKSACIVFEDVVPEVVAPKLATAAVIISGQQCTAARRVLVHASRLNEMKQVLAHALGQIRVLPGLLPDSQMGPLIDHASRDTIAARIERVFDAADEVLLQGSIPAGELAKGAFLTPSLVYHRDYCADFVQEEIFGPFLILESFEHEAEAVAKANATKFGLSASVWTHDGARALRVARALRSGTVWINDHNRLFAEAETGGYRNSGLGRLHGYDAFTDFTELKHIYQAPGIVGDVA